MFNIEGIDRVFTFHIRKNAGTSLVRAFKGAYPKNYIRIKRGFSSPQLQREDFTSPHYEKSSGHVRSPENTGSGTELVVGHMNYGIHQELAGRAMYVAFVREPISRLISLYEHLKRGRPQRMTVNGKFMSLMDYNAYLSDNPRGDMFNEQSKVLSGKFYYENDLCLDRCPDGVAEQAIENVENRIFFTGLHENLNESLRIMKALLGLDRLQVGHDNLGGYVFDADTISGADRKTLRRLHEADCELYDTAVRRYRSLTAGLRSIDDPQRVRELVQDWIRSTAKDEGNGGLVPPMECHAG